MAEASNTADIDLTPVLEAITQLLLSTLEGSDPRRFVVIQQVSKSTTKLTQAVSLRVEDFEDEGRRKRNGLGYFKELIGAPQVTVPADIDPSAGSVLEAMSKGIALLLRTTRSRRFNEAERVADAALHFIACITPPRGKKPSRGGDVAAIGCQNPEDTYLQDEAELGMEDDEARPANTDTNQLRREILEIEGAQSQVLGELAVAKVAREEAAELLSLLEIRKQGDLSLLAPTTARIEQLRANLQFRMRGNKNAVVSTNVLRGHLAGSEGRRDHPPQGDSDAAERAQGPRSPSQEGAGETVRMFTMGDA